MHKQSNSICLRITMDYAYVRCADFRPDEETLNALTSAAQAQLPTFTSQELRYVWWALLTSSFRYCLQQH